MSSRQHIFLRGYSGVELGLVTQSKPESGEDWIPLTTTAAANFTRGELATALHKFRNGIPLTTDAAANFTLGELATALVRYHRQRLPSLPFIQIERKRCLNWPCNSRVSLKLVRTDEVVGAFESIQPSYIDLGAKALKDFMIQGVCCILKLCSST
ncbi:proteasome endopeptidase complex [Trifolium repens]|nr:proteasome endopeptidase complex [Trifolium repens]